MKALKLRSMLNVVLGGVLEASCGRLGGVLGTSWGRLGGVLGSSRSLLGASWNLLGASWKPLENETQLGTLSGHLKVQKPSVFEYNMSIVKNLS